MYPWMQCGSSRQTPQALQSDCFPATSVHVGRQLTLTPKMIVPGSISGLYPLPFGRKGQKNTQNCSNPSSIPPNPAEKHTSRANTLQIHQPATGVVPPNTKHRAGGPIPSEKRIDPRPPIRCFSGKRRSRWISSNFRRRRDRRSGEHRM